MLTLYYHPSSPSSLRVRLVLVEKQLPFRRRVVTRDDLLGGLCPEANQATPMLSDDSVTVCDAMVIAHYLEDAYPRPLLLPPDARGKAVTRMMLLRIDRELLPAVERLSSLVTAHEDRADEQAEVRQALSSWDIRLKDSGLLSGTEMSLADVWLVSAMERAELLGASIPEEFVHLARWRARMQERASVRTERLEAD